MLKVGKELHLISYFVLPFLLVSYLEGGYIMKLSSMRRNEMVDFSLHLDIQQSLLLQQLMLLSQWRC